MHQNKIRYLNDAEDACPWRACEDPESGFASESRLEFDFAFVNIGPESESESESESAIDQWGPLHGTCLVIG